MADPYVTQAPPALDPPDRLRLAVGPALLLAGVIAYSAASGLALAPRAGVFGIYLATPVVLLLLGPRDGVRGTVTQLAAILALWLPIERGLLPPLPVPAPGGYDVAKLVGFAAGLYLFLVARPLDGVGLTYRLRARDMALALGATAVFAAIALPVALATDFISWGPQLELRRVLLVPLVIYLVTALPEEFLFRGLIQNLLRRHLGPNVALAVASIVFGLAHLPDPRYVVLATVAGVAYGCVYQRTGKITVSAVTHAMVDAIWVLLLRG